MATRERTAGLEQTLTTLRDTQEQLVRREKLAMLGQLASGVGHELRNPLGVMTNAVYYLEMIQPDAPPDVQEYLGILRAQIGLAEKIVGDLLDFSHIRPPRRDVALRSTFPGAYSGRCRLLSCWLLRASNSEQSNRRPNRRRESTAPEWSI